MEAATGTAGPAPLSESERDELLSAGVDAIVRWVDEETRAGLTPMMAMATLQAKLMQAFQGEGR